MIRPLSFVAGVAGTCALAGSLLTGALASPPPPFHAAVKPTKNQAVNGNLTVGGVVKINKNNSVYGKLYAHGGAQVWKGLLVRTGGVTADKLDVAGAITGGGALQVQSATIAGNLQAGAITGTSLALNGAATVNGTLSVTQKITGNGVDAGAGDITTTGKLTGGALTASSITDAGALTAASATLSGLTVSGAVNFTGATVTGLSASSLSIENATLHALTVDRTLNVGANAATTAPLQVTENNRTAQVGVDANGNLTVPSLVASGNVNIGGALAVAGGLTLGGTSTLTVPGLQGTPASGSTTPGPLQLSSSAITLNGPTTIASGQDFSLSTSTNGANGHFLSGGSRDVAGQLTVTIPSGTPAGTTKTNFHNFARPYATAPIVVISLTNDPEPGCGSTASTGASPKYWVTSSTTGFTISAQLAPSSCPTQDAVFNYVVIGQ